MSRIYLYKLTVDDGGAPCVAEDLLSLAICKPGIRATARRDDVILGFAGNGLYHDNCLVYAAKVTAELDGREYFSESRYAARPDAIYFWDGKRFEWKKTATYHSSGSLVHDLGEAPQYERANVLLSDGCESFRYFGDECPFDYKHEYPRLKLLIETLGQGHRVNHQPALRDELQQFIERLWKLESASQKTRVFERHGHDRCSQIEEHFECIDFELPERSIESHRGRCEQNSRGG